MTILLIVAVLAVAIILIRWWVRARHRAEIARYCVDPAQLHQLLESNPDTLVIDVRLPLDLLADPTIIPGALRVPPHDIINNPGIIPADRDAIVYCTCPGEGTSRKIVKKALALNFHRIKLLAGGLNAWKEKGYPVEPYTESFHLDTPGRPASARG